MGAIGRLFGLGLVIAGLVIAVYWTAWVLMLLVKTITPITQDIALLPDQIQLSLSLLPGASVDLPLASDRSHWRNMLHRFLHHQHQPQARGRESY